MAIGIDRLSPIRGSLTHNPANALFWSQEFTSGWPQVQVEAEKAASSARIRRLADIVMAPTEIAGLPLSGSRDGQRTIGWGLTSGAETSMVVFAPSAKFRPSLPVRCALKLKMGSRSLLDGDNLSLTPNYPGFTGVKLASLNRESSNQLLETLEELNNYLER